MYRPTLSARDRGGVILAVALIHVGLIFALVRAGGDIPLIDEQRALEIFDLRQPEPPPPIEPIREPERQREKEGAASPANIKSEATPVVRPTPRVEVPAPPVITASPTPRQGAEPTQGAAPVPGPGTGAGGTGTGTGSGGQGSGTGGGGEGTRPVLITPTLDGRRDYPREVLRRWPSRGRVFVRFQVAVDGRPFNCIVDRSSGDRSVDQWTCSLVVSKLRFRPARRPNGEPYVSWFGYVQAPVNF